MHIYGRVVNVSKAACWVLRRIYPAIICITLLREWLSKFTVEKFEYLAGFLKWLEQYIYHEENIDSENTKEYSPEDWMRPFNEGVRKLYGCKSKETHY